MTQITLRDEINGPEHRSLIAYLDEAGNLHIDGHDLGPSLVSFIGEDEYEWFRTIAAEHIPAAIASLGGSPGDDILDLLRRNWSGTKSALLESTLTSANIPMDFASF